jgi:hypothetical protein
MKSNVETLEQWAGSSHPMLVLLFTDIVDSTAIGKRLGDAAWIKDLEEHFHNGYVIKVIGDAFMIAFRNSTDAVDFAVDLSTDTGVPYIGVRVGVHSGQVQIVDNDIYGLNVNLAARIQTSVLKEGIAISEPVKNDYENRVGTGHGLSLKPDMKDLKNFKRTRVFGVGSRELLTAWKGYRTERSKIVPQPTATVPTATVEKNPPTAAKLPPLFPANKRPWVWDALQINPSEKK